MPCATNGYARRAGVALATEPTWLFRKPARESANANARFATTDPRVRAGISMLAHAGDVALADGLTRLAADLRAGQWLQRHSELLEQDHLDAGYRLLISDLDNW
jgi:hypothetical protein